MVLRECRYALRALRWSVGVSGIFRAKKGGELFWFHHKEHETAAQWKRRFVAEAESDDGVADRQQ